MIQQITRDNIPECVKVIRESFATVAGEFGFTEANAPRFTAFSTTTERLNYQLDSGRSMYAYLEGENIVGYYSLCRISDTVCELNNLCVLPEYRHDGIGGKLLGHAFDTAKQNKYEIMNIGIVEENVRLRKWYESFGFVHTETKKFDFFPFTCGYMEKKL